MLTGNCADPPDSFDTTPSILHHALSPVNGDHPSPKKARTSEPETTPSVASLVRSQKYISLDDFEQDLNTAIKETLEDDEASEETNGIGDKTNFAEKAERLKREVKRILQRERLLGSQLSSELSTTWVHGDPKAPINGVEKPEVSTVPTKVSQGRTVLTLYGTAPTPKQLFSSLRDDHINANGDTFSGHGLPNGISVTRIIPPIQSSTKTSKREQRLGEIFAPSSSQPPLNPPRQSRKTTTRSSSIDWFDPVDVMTSSSRPNRRDPYAMQPQSTGKWLKYGRDKSAASNSSSEAKRKQRGRTLSSGEKQDAEAPEIQATQRRAEEDALFWKVYSNFGPDRDSSFATVPENIKSKVWWSRIGERRFDAREDALPYQDGDETDGISAAPDHDKDMLQDPVEVRDDDEYVPVGWEPLQDSKPSPEVVGDNYEDAIQEISKLIELLHSHQRVRHLAQNASSRVSASQNTQSGPHSGSTSSPSTDEAEVHRQLKARLATVVSSLPPSILARLGGDESGELGIAAEIPIAVDGFRGTMEEEDLSTKSKPASTAAAGISSRLTGATSVTANSSRQNYASASTPQTVQRNSFSTQLKAPSSVYQPNQYTNRPAGQYYNAQGQSSYNPSQSSTSAANRYPYTSTSASQYKPNATPLSNQYSSVHRPFSGTSGAYNQSYSSPSYNALLQGSQASRPSQPTYPRSTAGNPPALGYNALSLARTASPQQSAGSYNTPNRGMNIGGNTTATQPRASLYQGNAGTVTTPLSAEQQAALISRLKAQNAEAPKATPIAGSSALSATVPQPTGPAHHTNGVATANGQRTESTSI